ncbi:MAG: XTP/dITP diphosphatase [Chloroflexota bacterium]|nr:XTP/dITP diphosphatase [Chloroflexota bacterium]
MEDTFQTLLLLATNNPAKVEEYRLLLKGMPWELTTLEERGIHFKVEETGKTMEENAALKARAYAARSGLVAVADDSGLEVEALGGGPGPISARYAGEVASDREMVAFLLEKLRGVPWEKRKARFRCVIALATPEGKLELCQGECKGIIAQEPKGEEGFGYDPVFYLPELGKHMAELTMQEKNRISHRGRAARKARRVLRRLLESIPS